MPTGDRDEFNLQEAFVYARSTIHTLIVINGGAAAAIVAFYGQALSTEKASTAVKILLANALTGYTMGVVSAVMILVFGYFTQFFWGASHSTEQETTRRERAAVICQVTALIFAFLSLVLFVCGSIYARSAFLL